MLICWNLMCRSASAVHIKFQHLEWVEDALCIYLAQQKNDQNRERPWDPRHVYPNPLMPEICPVLSLGLYWLTYSFSTNSDRLYPGSDQYDGLERFCVVLVSFKKFLSIQMIWAHILFAKVQQHIAVLETQQLLNSTLGHWKLFPQLCSPIWSLLTVNWHLWMPSLLSFQVLVITSVSHINKNFLAHTKRFFPVQEDFDSFMENWTRCEYSNSEEDFKAQWHLTTTLSGSSGWQSAVWYVQDTWIPFSERFNKCYVEQFLHMGSASKSRGEGNHGVIKRSIKASNADLLVVFQRVDGMLRAQFVQLEQAMQKDKTSVYHRHKQTWELPCKHQIRLVISSMWKGETWA